MLKRPIFRLCNPHSSDVPNWSRLWVLMLYIARRPRSLETSLAEHDNSRCVSLLSQLRDMLTNLIASVGTLLPLDDYHKYLRAQHKIHFFVIPNSIPVYPHNLFKPTLLDLRSLLAKSFETFIVPRMSSLAHTIVISKSWRTGYQLCHLHWNSIQIIRVLVITLKSLLETDRQE